MTFEKVEKTEPVFVESSKVLGLRRPYMLYKSDYQSLTKIPTYLPIWAHTVSAAATVYFFGVVSKLIAMEPGQASPISVSDWWFLGLLGASVLVLQVLNWCLPSEKRRMESKIEKYYEIQHSDGVMVEQD